MRPSDQELEQHWWHRLFKVVLWGSTSAIVLFILLIAVDETARMQERSVRSVKLSELMMLTQFGAKRAGAAAAHVEASELIPKFLGMSGNIMCEKDDGSIEDPHVGKFRL
jgi:hypothetical protein